MGIRYPVLQETPEYIKMDKNFQISFENAQKLLTLDLRDKAKEQIYKYITVISKQKLLQLITYKDSKFKEFLLAYDKNDFKSCYEIMDKYKDIKLTKIAKLLEIHWERTILQCELYSKSGDINSYIKTMGPLLFTSTRVNNIEKLLKKTFHTKIQKLLKSKNFISCEAVLYSYIDIFSNDKRINELMNKFEKESKIILAITQQKQKTDKNAWLYSKIIKNLSS